MPQESLAEPKLPHLTGSFDNLPRSLTRSNLHGDFRIPRRRKAHESAD